MSDLFQQSPTGPRRAVVLPPRRIIKPSITLAALAIACLFLTTCSRRPDALTQVMRTGELRVATVNSATTYYLGVQGPEGFEYDLAKRFAHTLGVHLKIIVVPDRASIVRAVDSGRAQIGAGLDVSTPRRSRVRFSEPYLTSKLQAVYRTHKARPHKLSDLSGKLVLPEGTALADWLRTHRPKFKFSVDDDANTETLMAAIAHGDINTTVANADLVAMNQRYFTKLRVGFTLKALRARRAWALSRIEQQAGHNRLFNRVVAFLEHVQHNGRLKILHDRYFSHAAQLGFVGGAVFAKQVKKRLHQWKAYFKKAGKRNDVDWRLLAAIGYQESHWDAKAVSPTHVRGIMMLTRYTAHLMNVDNRRNPQESIDGGARYLRKLRRQVPDAVKPPDRTWFALAAYNVGLGHVLDARRLLKEHGRNPNVWVNLRRALPWLTEKRYLDDTKYGYAHGKVAAAYVDNIRAYYDILKWMTGDSPGHKPAALSEKPSAGGADADSGSDDISVTSPAF